MKIFLLSSQLPWHGIPILMLGILLIGCAGSSIESTPIPPSTSNTLPSPTLRIVQTRPPLPGGPDLRAPWAKRLFAGEPCAAPCWEGITPGLSSRQEAIAILMQLPETVINDPTAPSIHFGIPSERVPGSFGSLSFDTTAPYTVTAIVFEENSFTLGSLIAVYGEPQEVLATAHTIPLDGGQHIYDLWLLYPRTGMMLGTNTTAKPDVNRELRITTIIFFVPGDSYREAFEQERQRGAVFTLWEGYRSFAYYCRGDEKAILCAL